MGWFETDAGLLGDGPVDLLEDRMAEWAAEGIQPSWQQWLDGVAAALHDRGREWIADSGALAGLQVCARFSPPGVELRSRPDAPRDRCHDVMSDAFQHISEEYEEMQHRKPTARELLGTLAFSLSVEPERFLRNEEGLTLEDVQLCRPGNGS